MTFEQLAWEQMIVVEAIGAEGNEGVRSIMSLLKGYCKSDIDDIVRSKHVRKGRNVSQSA